MLEVGGTLQVGPNTNRINVLYDYLIDNKIYENKYRINRNEKGCANCIFWGKKLSDEDLNNKTVYKGIEF